MPADYSLLQPSVRLNTPFENLASVMQLRAQQENMRGLKEQREAIAEQRRAQTEKTQRENAEAVAVRALFTRPDQPPTMDELAGVIGPDKAAAVFQGFEAVKTARAGNAKADVDRIASVLGGLEALPAEMRPDAYAGALKVLTADGTLKPGQAPAVYNPAFVKAKRREALTALEQFAQDKPPADYTLGNQRMSGETNQPIATAAPTPGALGSAADFVAKWAADRRLDPAKLSAAQTAAALQAHARATQAPSQAVDNSPLETIMGPNGTPIRVRRQDAIGKAPAASTEKASSGVQKRVLNFFNRAQQADTELENMEGQVQEMGLAEQGRMALAPNVLQSQIGQSYTAAQRAFTEARLRKDSGAAIPPQEFANDRRTYFAQPGDSKETLEQKRRARAAILASLAFESGQALGEFVGDAEEAKSIVERYKARASGSAKPNKIGRFEIVQ